MWALLVWLFWTIAVPTAIAIGVSYLLRPDIEKPSVTGKYRFELPTAEEGRPFPVLFGKCRIRGLNAISPIFNKDRRVMIQHDVIVGIRYYCGLHLGVGIGHINIKLLLFGDTTVWPAKKQPSIEAADNLAGGDIDADDCWGRWDQGGAGGVNGNFAIQYGDDSQTLHYVLKDKFGSDQPAYRGFTSLILYGPYIGTSPQIRPISVLGKRTDWMCDYTTMWYLAKANMGDDDLNAIHIIYEILTSTIIGRGIDPSLIGDSFKNAADTCYDEGYGLSCVWDWAPDSIGAMIEQIEKIVDGKLYFSLETEKYEFGLNRPVDPEGLEEFDESDFWIESAGYLSMGLIPDKVIVLWEERLYNTKRVAYDDDIALYARQNEESHIDEKDYSNFIYNSSLARKIASRDQYMFSAMPKRFILHCLRTMIHLHETSVFKISYPALNITSMMVRLVSIDRGSLTDSECIIECIEDVFGQAYTVYSEPPESKAEEEEGIQESEYYDQESTVWDRLSNQIVYDKLSGNMVTWRHD